MRPTVYDQTTLPGPGPMDPEDWMPSVLSVEPLPGYRLAVTLSRDRRLNLDLTGVVFGDPVFAPARDPTVFATATRSSEGGRSVLWGDDENSPMEIGSDTLLEMAEAQCPLSGADLRAWQEKHGLNNREAAAMLDTSLRTLQRYLEADALPGPIRLAMKTMDARPAVFSAFYRPSTEGRGRKPGSPVRPGRPAKV